MEISFKMPVLIIILHQSYYNHITVRHPNIEHYLTVFNFESIIYIFYIYI